MRWQVGNTEDPDHAPYSQSVDEAGEPDKSVLDGCLRSNHAFLRDFLASERRTTVHHNDCSRHELEIPDQTCGPIIEINRTKRWADPKTHTPSTHSKTAEPSDCIASADSA